MFGAVGSIVILALPGFALSSVTCGVGATGIVLGLVALTSVAPAGIGLPTVYAAGCYAVAILYVFPGVRKLPVMFPPFAITCDPGTIATTFPDASVTT